MTKTNEALRIEGISNQLYQASQSIRILSHIDWPVEVKTAFFEKKATALPVINYPKFDA